MQIDDLQSAIDCSGDPGRNVALGDAHAPALAKPTWASACSTNDQAAWAARPSKPPPLILQSALELWAIGQVEAVQEIATVQLQRLSPFSGLDLDIELSEDELYEKLGSLPSDPTNLNGGRLFKFDVHKEDPLSLHFFNLRWEDADGVFAVGIGPGTGFPVQGTTPVVTYLGDDINDATKPRVFEISGGQAVVKQRISNKVFITLACPNDHVIEVTVGATMNN